MASNLRTQVQYVSTFRSCLFFLCSLMRRSAAVTVTTERVHGLSLVSSDAGSFASLCSVQNVAAQCDMHFQAADEKAPKASAETPAASGPIPAASAAPAGFGFGSSAPVASGFGSGNSFAAAPGFNFTTPASTGARIYLLHRPCFVKLQQSPPPAEECLPHQCFGIVVKTI